MARGNLNTSGVQTAATSMAEEDRRVAATSRAATNTLLLEKIIGREKNTRELNSSHVVALADSIAALGLLEPLVVDAKGRLLAGGHRVAAVTLLRHEKLNTFKQIFPSGIPVRTLLFDAASDPKQALAVEVAENEHRRDYTRDEALQIAERLKQAGYKDTAGRPAKGEKALAPALQAVMGKSLRTVRRILSEAGSGPPEVTLDSSLHAVERALGRHAELFGRHRKGSLLEINEKIRELQQLIKDRPQGS